MILYNTKYTAFSHLVDIYHAEIYLAMVKQ